MKYELTVLNYWVFSISMLLLISNMSSHSRIWNPKYITNSPDSFSSPEFLIQEYNFLKNIYYDFFFYWQTEKKCLTAQTNSRNKICCFMIEPMSSLQSRIAAIIHRELERWSKFRILRCPLKAQNWSFY